LLEQWTIALDCYKKALNENPNDSIALRGMGLVQYRLGDITTAANSIKKAYDNGDKDAAVDGIELFLLSKYRFVWNMFKDKVDVSKMSLDVRAGLVQYASEQKDCADMFFNALKQKDSDILFTDTKVRSLVRMGLDKYATDPRAKDIAKRLYNAVEKK
jgi:tetratricopeptide (TPR) repeat protein